MSGRFEVRRATLDDLPALRQLWEKNGLATSDLEKKLTEFQIIRAEDGDLLGCLGIQMAAQQGRVHSESWLVPTASEELWIALWERTLSVARNHGLYRIWGEEVNETWANRGFVAPTPELLTRLPSAFGEANPVWKVFPLKEELAGTPCLEHEFELFQEAARENSRKALRQAQVIKIIAGFLAFIIFLLTIGFAAYALKRLPPRR